MGVWVLGCMDQGLGLAVHPVGLANRAIYFHGTEKEFLGTRHLVDQYVDNEGLQSTGGAGGFAICRYRGFRVSGCGFRASGFEFLVSDFGSRVSGNASRE